MIDILDFMAADHDRLDRLLADFREARTSDPSHVRSLFHDFRDGLERHIVWEEEILFPLFEERTGMRDSGPTAVMRYEHGEIRELLARIDATLEDGTGGTEDLEQSLVRWLTAHNEREENILYPAMDSMLTNDERDQALARIRAEPAGEAIG